MNSITAYSPDRFSMGRLAMVARYYWPTVRLQVIIYPAVSLLAGIIIALCKNHMTAALLLTGLLTMPLSLLLNFGPLVFAFKSNQEIETLIPARTSEKTTFLILYNMVVMPILITVPKWIITTIFFPDMALAMAGPEGADIIRDMLNNQTWWKDILSIAQTLMPVAVCMFCVFKIKKRRVLYSIIWTVVSITIPALFGMVMGIWFVVSDIVNNGTPEPLIKEQIMDIILPITWCLCAFATAIDVLFCWLTARTIRRNQY